MARPRSIFDADVDHHKLIGTDENLSAFLRFEREMERMEEERERQKKLQQAQQLSLEQIQFIQFECMADDIPIEFDIMRTWRAEDVREFFESGGATRPVSSAPAASAEPVTGTPDSRTRSAASSAPVAAPTHAGAAVQQYQMDMVRTEVLEPAGPKLSMRMG